MEAALVPSLSWPKNHLRDSRHWTAIDQTWNLCARIATRRMFTNYDPRTRTYATRYNEIDVAAKAVTVPDQITSPCQKDNGWAKVQSVIAGSTIALAERNGVSWSILSLNRQSPAKCAAGPRRTKSRCARVAIRVVVRFTKTTSVANPSATIIASRYSMKIFISRTAKSRARSMSTGLSSRAGCFKRA